MLNDFGILEHDDGTESDKNLAVRERNNNIEREYTPFSSSYNSITLWSINGAMPDENSSNHITFKGNTYSNRKCAIVDYLRVKLIEEPFFCKYERTIENWGMCMDRKINKLLSVKK